MTKSEEGVWPHYTALKILKLTKQEHPVTFKYDKVYALYVSDNKNKQPSLADVNSAESVLCVGAIGIVGKRVVDVAVHPGFKRRGIGKALVKLGIFYEDVNIAYAVSKEACKFWHGINWRWVGRKEDKGTLVEVFVRNY